VAFNPPIVDDEIPSAAKWNSAVGVYDRATAEIDVASTTVATAIYSKAIGAGHLSSDRMLRLSARGDLLNNTASSQGVTVTFKLGATTLVTEAGVTSIPTSAARRPWRIYMELSNLGAANSQEWHAQLVIGRDGGGYTTSGFHVVGAHSGTSAVDTAAEQTLAVEITWPTSSASLSWRRKYAMLELL
jgi:hypothetical protein